jgi:lipoate-protein ligase A
MDRTWRLIDSGPCSASHNMAIDEAIATLVRKDCLPPALRLYGWDRPSVSLGCFQRASDIDVGYCEAEDIPVVRRPTGGRAILHDDELTYSFSAGTDRGPFSKGLLDSYKKISAALHLALKKVGVSAESKSQREKGRVLAGSPLCFQSSSYGEILICNKKVVGSAQKRWDDGLLQQGSIPYSYDGERVRRIFGEGRYTALRECAVGLKEVLPHLDDAKFREIISASFEEAFGISLVPAHPSQEESALALELERKKYLLARWNFRE